MPTIVGALNEMVKENEKRLDGYHNMEKCIYNLFVHNKVIALMRYRFIIDACGS